jgi:hypothetical protein
MKVEVYLPVAEDGAALVSCSAGELSESKRRRVGWATPIDEWAKRSLAHISPAKSCTNLPKSTRPAHEHIIQLAPPPRRVLYTIRRITRNYHSACITASSSHRIS